MNMMVDGRRGRFFLLLFVWLMSLICENHVVGKWNDKIRSSSITIVHAFMTQPSMRRNSIATPTSTGFVDIKGGRRSIRTKKKTLCSEKFCHHRCRFRHRRMYMSIPTPLDTFTSGLASIVRLPRGVTVISNSNNPNDKIKLKVLYDIENNASCRRVREVLTELDLNVDLILPSAPNSRVFCQSNADYTLPPNSIIPRLLVEQQDDGSDVKMMEFVGLDDILNFLDRTYGPIPGTTTTTTTNDNEEEQSSSSSLLLATKNLINPLLLQLATLLRFGRGTTVSSCAAFNNNPNAPIIPRPTKPLLLYSYEGNQFCRLVREVLLELDLPYVLRNVGKESPQRINELSKLYNGSTQCPRLVDINTNVSMLETLDIVQYLYSNYALYTPPNILLQSISPITTLLKPIYNVISPLQAGRPNSKDGDTAPATDDKDEEDYQRKLEMAKNQIQSDISSHPIVIYTYTLSPFCTEAKTVLKNLQLDYNEITLGLEWIPGLIRDPMTREALRIFYGRSSLPHIFLNGKSIGGLFDGTPGLISSLDNGDFQTSLVKQTKE